MTSALRWGGWSAPHPGRLTPPRKTRYPLYRRLGGPQGPVWTGAENLAPTGIRSPDRPARSESLYRLSYPGPHSCNMHHNINFPSTSRSSNESFSFQFFNLNIIFIEITSSKVNVSACVIKRHIEGVGGVEEGL